MATSLLLDSTGVKMCGGGEWQVRRHGLGRRQWRKVHLAMDAATGDSRGVEFTSSQTSDGPVLSDVLAKLPTDQAIGTVTADRACDTRTCDPAIAGHGGTAVIPTHKNGRPWMEDGSVVMTGNETLRATRYFGRALWKRLTGYHARGRIEAQMLRLKAFGERTAASDSGRHAAGIHTRIALMNRFSALGRAEIVRPA